MNAIVVSINQYQNLGKTITLMVIAVSYYFQDLSSHKMEDPHPHLLLSSYVVNEKESSITTKIINLVAVGTLIA